MPSCGRQSWRMTTRYAGPSPQLWSSATVSATTAVSTLPRWACPAPATAQPRAWCPARWTSVQSPLLSPPPSPFSCPTFLFSHPHVRNNSDLRALTCRASLPQPRRRLLGGLRPFVSVAASPILTGSELEARNCIPFLLVRPAPWHQSHTWHIHFSEF